MNRRPATAYLLHLDQPYQHARHHTGKVGSSRSLKAQLAEHEKDKGVRLLQVVKAAATTWTLARTWPGDRTRERRLKPRAAPPAAAPDAGSTAQHQVSEGT